MYLLLDLRGDVEHSNKTRIRTNKIKIKTIREEGEAMDNHSCTVNQHSKTLMQFRVSPFSLSNSRIIQLPRVRDLEINHKHSHRILRVSHKLNKLAVVRVIKHFRVKE